MTDAPDAHRMCLLLEDDETKCYANSAALLALADELIRIAQANPEACHEVHVRLALSAEPTVSSGQFAAENVWVDDKRELKPPAKKQRLPRGAVPFGYELTFMHVSDDALDLMKPKA